MGARLDITIVPPPSSSRIDHCNNTQQNIGLLTELNCSSSLIQEA